jgi:sulfoxide reductase catalytic subunit YedY
MPWIRKHRGFELPEREATPEHLYFSFNRREFLRAAGLAGAGAVSLACLGVDRQAAQAGGPSPEQAASGGLKGEAAIEAALRAHPGKYPATRSPRFSLDRPLTDPQVAASYNNFYEFTNDKAALVRHSQELTLRPWTVEVAGLVEKPLTLDVDDLVSRLPLEERLYRHRCVEAWAMAVPWTGIPMRSFLDHVRPLSAARFVRMVTFYRPSEAIGQRVDTYYPWPYYEGLRMDEAANELAMLVTGIYGKPLSPQHGAPLRLVVPWKYGYKSIKSIVRIEFVKDQPPTFWNDLQPQEYDFLSNVNPNVPHPRWSQATERMLGTGERRPTLLYNGYGEWVAGLYA